MTGDQIEKAIEFLLNQQARTDAAMAEMRIQADADKKEMRESIKTMSDNVNKLSDNMNVMVEQANEDRAAVIEANAEIKDRINVLLTVVETTTELAKEAYALARSSEKRLTLLEGRVDKIENPHPE